MRLALYLAAAVYGLTYWYHPAHDPDLGWHLVGGAWMSRAHRPPTADFVNSFNTFWHDYHWLAQLGMFQLYRLGGYELLRFALGVVMALIGVVVMSIVLLRSRRPAPVIVGVLLYLGAMSLIGAVTAVRPQMLSVLILALAVRRLVQRPVRWELPYLFVLAVLLANMHVYWVFIPTLWALYRCLPRVYRRRAASPAYAWGGALLLTAAALISPYGLPSSVSGVGTPMMNYALVWEYLVMPPELKGAIHEFKSALAADGWVPLLLVGCLAFAVRRFRWRRFVSDLPNGVAFLVGALLALGSLKFVSVFALMGLPHLAREASAAWRRIPLPAGLRAGGWLEGPAVGGLLLLSALHAAAHLPWTARNNEYIADWQPVAACRRVARLDLTPNPRGHQRVLTHFNHGGWCRWAIYEEDPDADFRVTTDGRTQWVPPQHFLDGFDVVNAKGAGLATLQRWNPDVIVLGRSTALANVLRLAPTEYPVVFEDQNFAVFVPARRLEPGVSAPDAGL